MKSNINIDRLLNEMEKVKTPAKSFKKEDDGSWWKPELDKAGNGYAIIRFLPPDPVDGEDGLPWVRWWDHGFQGPTGQWYIENSITSLGKDVEDPVGEYNSQLWHNGTEAGKEQARKQKRRLHFASLIEVVEDSKNPQNVGKKFRFKYGSKIFDKILASMKPEFADETPVNPFELNTGANFKLKIRKVEGYTNYDKSEFDRPSTHKVKDATQYSLTELVSPDKFKTYDELKKRFETVMNFNSGTTQPSPAAHRAVAAQRQVKAEETTPSVEAEDDDKDDAELARFAQLANDD